MRLKDFLREDTPSREEQEMYEISRGSIMKNANGELYCRSDFNMNTVPQQEFFIENVQNIRRMKYKFHMVKGDYNVEQAGLTTLENFPFDVKGNILAWNNKISSLEGITPHIGGILDLCQNPGIVTFKGIGKLIKNCGNIIVPESLKSNLLGVLLIDKLEDIEWDDNVVSDYEIPELIGAIKIINKHLFKDRDVLECQEELAKAGYKEYAKL